MRIRSEEFFLSIYLYLLQITALQRVKKLYETLALREVSKIATSYRKFKPEIDDDRRRPLKGAAPLILSPPPPTTTTTTMMEANPRVDP